MIAKSLSCENFRNLKNVSFEPCEKVNVLCGANAQGKTNLIEALWLFSGMRSFRSSKDAEMIGFGESNCRISLSFSSRGIDNDATILLGEKKSLDLNGIKSERTTSLAGNFCEVVFSPDHLTLVKQGPQQRRKFIDFAITEILPRHGAALSEYTKILRQRNALLKDAYKNRGLLDMLPVWDEKLIKVGSQIIFARLRYIRRLSKNASEIYLGIAESSSHRNPNETLELCYRSCDGDIYTDDIQNTKSSLETIREKLTEDFKKSLASDIDCGHTTRGPHHDDMIIKIGEKEARLYASQGQQRSAVLALKLSEARVLTETIGEAPVLLLDDVMSELDPGRQNYILNNIGSCQVFITCCEPQGLENLEGGKIFTVESGNITET